MRVCGAGVVTQDGGTIQYCLARLDLEEDPLQHFLLARAYGQLGKYTEAIGALRKALSMHETNYILAELAYAYGRSGERVKAEEILKTLMEKQEYVDPYDIAFIHIGLGDNDNAIATLKEAYEVKSAWIPWIRVEPKFFGLHSDSRFQELLENLGLPSA